eukprot:13069001-Alexandrium_andersonii.AAC.1
MLDYEMRWGIKPGMKATLRGRICKNAGGTKVCVSKQQQHALSEASTASEGTDEIGAHGSK